MNNPVLSPESTAVTPMKFNNGHRYFLLTVASLMMFGCGGGDDGDSREVNQFCHTIAASGTSLV